MSKNPQFPLSVYNSGFDWSILTGLIPCFQYVNKQKQGDAPVAWKVETALPGNGMEKVGVRIEGSVCPLNITDQQIAESLIQLDFILIRFDDGKVQLYSRDGKIEATATATGVSIVKSE